jgi:D-glycero-alpha-D-manno-heptose 1-phosphate guanylyltransferase
LLATHLTSVILAGGLGTRLRASIGDLPKPLAPINGRPFLEYLLQWLRRQGLTRVVLCVGYRHELIEAYFGDGTALGMQISYSVEEKPLGTGGALANARAFLGSTFLVMNGDTFFDADLAPLLAAHRAYEVPATMSLVSVPDTTRYGAVVLDADGYITRFTEKGRSGQGQINAGVYALSFSIFDRFPPQLPISLENNVFTLLAQQHQLRGCLLHGYHIDIGTPESFAEFNRIQQHEDG